MEFLQQIFGSLTSGIVRLGVAVGILAAVYFFIVKPVLHTTEKTVEHSLHSLEKKASPKHLERCIKHADGDVDKMKRCTRIF